MRAGNYSDDSRSVEEFLRSAVLSFFLLQLSTVVAVGEINAAKPVDCAQLMTWMGGGISNQRLDRLVHERGISFALDHDGAEALSSAGASSQLLSDMRIMPASGAGTNIGCPARLEQAAKLVHQQEYEDAEPILRQLISSDFNNADLHFALAYVRQQQNDFNEAFDEYSNAKELSPGFPETHNDLSYLFDRSNDGDNAIAEARTALSIDPQNAEAYRYLGLGLYANEQYPSALYAFQESLAPNSDSADASPTLVIGFVGGFVHSDDRRHSEVQIARQIQATYGNDVQIRLFENRRRAQAHKLVLDWLKAGDGKLTDEEKRSARLILFGHSWGASAVVSLARELQQDGIPVLLTIQVDSVTKNGEDDSVIPANVAEAVNFYQTGGILHGRSKIRAADPSRTRILGNFRSTYQKEPAECRAYPWYDRLLFKGHTAIECDPRVWSQIEALIRMRLPPVLQSAQPQVAMRVGN